jgi:hypothetical protein
VSAATSEATKVKNRILLPLYWWLDDFIGGLTILQITQRTARHVGHALLFPEAEKGGQGKRKTVMTGVSVDFNRHSIEIVRGQIATEAARVRLRRPRIARTELGANNVIRLDAPASGRKTWLPMPHPTP